MGTQFLAVWHEGGFLEKKRYEVSFDTQITDKGLMFTITNSVELYIRRDDALGILYIENDVAVAAIPWIDLGITLPPATGDVVILGPKVMTNETTAELEAKLAGAVEFIEDTPDYIDLYRLIKKYKLRKHADIARTIATHLRRRSLATLTKLKGID